MAMTVLITLTTTGSDTGPFDLYSDVDGYFTAFETGISKTSLEAGYLSTSVPDGSIIIRVQSDNVLCDNYVDLGIDLTTTTTTTTSTTTTTTTTIAPTSDLIFSSYSGGQFTFTLTSPVDDDTVISIAQVDGFSGGCGGVAIDGDTLSSAVTILSGNSSNSGMGSSPMGCGASNYKRFSNITVNGISKMNGETLTIGTVLVTVIIDDTTCETYAC